MAQTARSGKGKGSGRPASEEERNKGIKVDLSGRKSSSARGRIVKPMRRRRNDKEGPLEPAPKAGKMRAGPDVSTPEGGFTRGKDPHRRNGNLGEKTQPATSESKKGMWLKNKNQKGSERISPRGE